MSSGSRIGILGGGQLGRMLALAAHPLGLEPVIVDPKPGCSASAVTTAHAADWDDPEALATLARCDVVTYEFENVPSAVVRRLAESVCVRPTPAALEATSDRYLEKQLLERLGIPTARYAAVETEAELAAAAADLGLPAVLKTRRFGYDGRGQYVLRTDADVALAWEELGGWPLVLEEFVAFEREVSLVAVRSQDGEVRFWVPTENLHVDGILRISRAPARGVDDAAMARAQACVTSLMAHLDYIGVLVVEFFVRDGVWIANEVACRVHNSGHWTEEGAVTSQFENHVRAITGLPLGATRIMEPSAMVDLIGRMPPAESVLAIPGARLHDYGKSAAPGRKLGHATVTAPDPAEVEQRLAELVRVVDDASGEPTLRAADERLRTR